MKSTFLINTRFKSIWQYQLYIAGGWGCVEKLVEETRGDKIDRRQAEEFIENYLKQHNVPGKLQIRWVNKLNSGGKLQEYGRRNKPTARRLRLWISSGFAGVKFSRSMTAFANHEICTHALRALNDHAQVFGLPHINFFVGRRRTPSTRRTLFPDVCLCVCVFFIESFGSFDGSSTFLCDHEP